MSSKELSNAMVIGCSLQRAARDEQLGAAMKLIAYLFDGQSIEIRPASARRDWMDQTIDSFAYRCLPLNIANAHGWEILCPGSFSAIWNGSHEAKGLTVTRHDAIGDQASRTYLKIDGECGSAINEE